MIPRRKDRSFDFDKTTVGDIADEFEPSMLEAFMLRRKDWFRSELNTALLVARELGGRQARSAFERARAASEEPAESIVYKAVERYVYDRGNGSEPAILFAACQTAAGAEKLAKLLTEHAAKVARLERDIVKARVVLRDRSKPAEQRCREALAELTGARDSAGYEAHCCYCASDGGVPCGRPLPCPEHGPGSSDPERTSR